MNYPQHNKEIKTALLQQTVSDDSDRAPVIFTKADSALLKDHKPFFIPDFMGRIDYETEIVVRICKLGKAIPERFAHRYYDAVTVGIDFTARDLQKKLREEGQPWELSKGFDGSAVIGEWVSLKDLAEKKFKENGNDAAGKKALEDYQKTVINDINFHLDINGERRQTGCTKDMIFNVDRIISYISQFFMLKTGDLIYTGTPVGVGPVSIDDHLEGYLEGEKVLDFSCR